MDAWLAGFRRFWTPHLDALDTELARGRRERERAATPETNPETNPERTTS